MTDSERPNVRLSAEHLSRVKGALAKRAAPSVKPLTVGGESVTTVPATPNQTGLWFVGQYQQDTSAYTVTSTLRLSGALDHAALKLALDDLVRRHGALRITLHYADDHLQQRVSEDIDQCWEFESGKLISSDAREDESTQLGEQIREWVYRPFDMSAGPLFRVMLIRLSADEHALVLNAHHAITDGWSQRILMSDLAFSYNARVVGLAPEFERRATQFTDIVQRRQPAEVAQRLSGQLQLWDHLLDGIPECIDLPTDFPRQPSQSYRGSQHLFAFDAQQTQRLRAVASARKTTPFCILLSALNLVLFCLSRQSHVVVGVPVAGRSQPEHESAVGYFANTVPIAVPVAAGMSSAAFVDSVRERLLSSIELQDTPLEKLVERRNPKRSLAHHPLFQVAFSMQPQLAQTYEFDGLTVERLKPRSSKSRFDFTLMAELQDTTSSFKVEFSTDLFTHETIERWMQQMWPAVEFLASDDGQTLDEFGARRELQRTVSDACVPDLFKQAVRLAPNKTAVFAPGAVGEQSISYAQLDRRSGLLASRLRAAGAVIGAPVGMCLPRGIDACVAMLAILKVGGAYLPLVPSDPSSRTREQLRDSGARLVVVEATGVESLDSGEIRQITVGEAVPDSADIATRLPDIEPDIDPDSAACVLYTSGSTGTPKGVMVPHRAIVRLVQNAGYADLGAQHVMLHMAPLAFDAATLEVWGPLLNGGTCVIYSQPVPEPRVLRALVRDYQITTAWLTSSLFNALVDEAPDALQGLHEIMTGGEALSVAHVRRAQQRLPGVRLTNGYGPTENGTFTTTYRIPDNFPATQTSVPIGKPIAGTVIFVLDEARQKVAPGTVGELWVGGAGVALGYLNHPQDPAFIYLPALAPGLLYRTGDRVRELADGNLDFVGRNDSQIKLNGHRVELGELERAWLRLPEVDLASVVVVERPAGKQLAAFVVLVAGADRSPAQLREQLACALAEYQLPHIIELLPRLPINANGKVDKAALVAGLSLPVDEPQAESAVVDTPSDVERELLLVWREVLGQPTLQPTDDFFDRGGHSLLAVRLMGRIESRFGHELPLGSLFASPTVREQALLLNRPGAARTPISTWSALVPVQPKGSLPPLFLIHALGGQVHGFREFVQHLPVDQPVYGVQSYGYVSEQAPHFDLVTMAAAYVQEIRALQPRGPYFLGGLSLGGLIAHEMVVQLERQGQRVAFLMIGDTAFARGAHIHPANRRLASWLRWFPPLSMIGGIWRWYRRARAPRKTSEPNPFQQTLADDPVFAARHALVKAAHHQALATYEPARINADVTLIKANSYPSSRAALHRLAGGPLLGWDRLTRGAVRVVPMSGGHHDIFYGNNAQTFARALSEQLAATEDLRFLRCSAAQPGPPSARADSQPLQVDTRRTAPCSPAQRRTWFVQQLDPDSVSANVTRSFRIDGALRVDVLQQALNWLVERHEPLRTTFELHNGQPLQVIHSSIDSTLLRERVPVARSSAASSVELLADASIREIIDRHVGHVFDLHNGPLLRPVLLELAGDGHLLVFVFHHLVIDGWSMDVLKTDLSEAYRAIASDEQPGRPPLTHSYSEVVAESPPEDATGAALEYWRRQLQAPLQRLELCRDGDQNRTDNAVGMVSRSLGAPLQEQLRTYASEKKMTTFSVVLAVFNALFQRLGQDPDVVLGMPASGRQSPDSLELIGYFVNTLVIRNRVQADLNFDDLCLQVWTNLSDALAHQSTQFEQLVDELVDNRSLDQTPFFDVLINSQASVDRNPLQLAGASVEELPRQQLEAAYELTVYINNVGSEKHLTAVFKRHAFSSAAIEELLSQFVHLAGLLCEHSQLPLQRFSLRTETARKRLPAPTAPLVTQPFESVAGEFLRMADSCPDACALLQGESAWSYHDVRQVALQWAGALRSANSDTNSDTGLVVAVYGERTHQYWSAVLGVMLSGNVLLLLDSALSAEQLTRLVHTAGADIICATDASGATAFVDRDGVALPVVSWVELAARATNSLAADLPPINAADPAYVFCTSGTTGVPKAVLGRHDSLQNFICWERERLEVAAGDRVAQLTSPTFDVVLRDVFLPLTSGATLVLPAIGASAGERAALEWLSSASITVLHTVPSLLRTWLAVAGTDAKLPDLRVVVSSGEPLHGRLVDAWRQRFGAAARLLNLYGCTEATLAQSCYEVPDGSLPELLPVGKAIAGSQLLVCTSEGQPCGIHERGNVIIRTRYPTLGYVAESAIDNSFLDGSAGDGSVRYGTGDTGYYTPAGDVVVTGRIDQQLKVRGVRVQPTAVAAWVEAHCGVARCAAVGGKNAAGDDELRLFVVADLTQTAHWLAALRNDLLHKAPAGYAPAALTELPELPLLANGKTDYLALRALAVSRDVLTNSPSDNDVTDSPTGRVLHAIWASALGQSRVAAGDNFFDLGGHSLLLPVVAWEIETQLGVKITLRELFTHATLAELMPCVFEAQRRVGASP